MDASLGNREALAGNREVRSSLALGVVCECVTRGQEDRRTGKGSEGEDGNEGWGEGEGEGDCVLCPRVELE
jgi:hypothetical protein